MVICVGSVGLRKETTGEFVFERKRLYVIRLLYWKKKAGRERERTGADFLDFTTVSIIIEMSFIRVKGKGPLEYYFRNRFDPLASNDSDEI